MQVAASIAKKEIFGESLQMDQAEADNVGRNQYGMLKLHQSGDTGSPGPSKYSGYSFANPVYEPGGAPPILPVTTTTIGSSSGSVIVDEATGSTAASAPSGSSTGPTYKVEDVIVRVRSGSGRGVTPTLRVRAFGGLASKFTFKVALYCKLYFIKIST